METMEYIGCFFEPAALETALEGLTRKPLSRPVAAPHVTFAFRPESVPAALFGEPVTVRAVGYGCDGKNEALQVEPVQMRPELAELWKQIPVPHITLSVSKKGRAVNSRHLEFSPMEPVTLTGVFGGMERDKKLHTESKK